MDNEATLGLSLDAWVAAGTIGLFVVTALLAWATFSLVWISADTARRQLRAYLSVGQPKFGKKVPDSVLFDVENVGQTPAHNVKFWFNTYWTTALDVGLPADFAFPDLPPSTDASGSVAVIGGGKSYQLGNAAEPELFQRALRKEIRLFIYGDVSYDDEFGRSHVTQFAWEYQATERDAGVEHKSRLLDRHNIAT